MNPRIKYKFKQLLTVVIGWTFIGLFFAVYDQIVWDYNKANYIFYIPENQSFSEHIILNLIGPILGGVFGGGFIIFYLRDKFKFYSYGKLLLFHGLTYLVIVVLVAILVVFINSSLILKATFWDDAVIARALNLLTDFGIWKVITFWFVTLILTIFLFEVNDKYGPGVLKNFILGKYHQPREEYRVFMFLDLKSSTTIAEKIGSKKYFMLLREFFNDVTEPILNTNGEIYQYVGDEITVSWKPKSSPSPPHCLDCFFEIKKMITERSEWYKKEFGVVPEFKAGIHYGLLTVGEIGQIKKEIVFSGDVLNTTARLMEECKYQGVDLLVSEALVNQTIQSGYMLNQIKETQLRGKQEKLIIYTVSI